MSGMSLKKISIITIIIIIIVKKVAIFLTQQTKHLTLSRQVRWSSHQPLPPARVAAGGLGRVDSLARVDHVRHVARVPGHRVRHLGTEIFLIYNSKYFCAAVSHSDLLQAAVGQVDEVLALGVVAVPRLAGAVVVLGVVVSHPDIRRITTQ